MATTVLDEMFQQLFFFQVIIITSCRRDSGYNKNAVVKNHTESFIRVIDRSKIEENREKVRRMSLSSGQVNQRIFNPFCWQAPGYPQFQGFVLDSPLLLHESSPFQPAEWLKCF